MGYWVLGFVLLAARLVAAGAPEYRSHSHNDYMQDRPLTTALEARMGSVEVDVWLVEEKLLVGHARDEVAPHRTLRSLYLDPLKELVRRQGGWIYPEDQSLVLLVDIKSEAESTYEAIDRELRSYRDLLTRYSGSETEPGAVTVLISGNVPKARMAAQGDRLAAADGRPADLEVSPPVSLVPVISENWTKWFSWDGRGEMPTDQRSALRAWVKRCHDQGRRVRLWAAPDLPGAWKEQAEAGVDFINTDRPGALSAFLATFVPENEEK